MRKPRSSGTLIAAASLFAALFANTAFFNAAFAAFGATTHGMIFAVSLFAAIASIFVLFLSALCHRKTVKPVLIAFLVLSSVLAYFTNKYGTIYDDKMIANVFLTDQAEARDLFNPQLLLYIVLLGVLPSLIVYVVPLARPHWRMETKERLKLAIIAGIALMAGYYPFSGHYAALFREHKDIVSKVNPAYALYSAGKLAAHAAASGPHAHITLGTDAKTPRSDGHNELVIMVVGETVRADHWQLNGYARETTPQLMRENVINFPDFWSCDTSTARSLPCMFSNLGHDKFDVDLATSEDNALDILQRAGVSVLWRDNNSSSKGVADRVTHEDFKTPEKNPVCDETECRDEGMLHGLQEYIDAQKGDVLIVLHQMGNHGPAYYKRYPKSFERFAPVCQTNDLGACPADEIANAYDNAILYTDDFLAKVIALLKTNDAKFETAMLYMSDHGESLGEYGVYLHGLPYALAPDAQKHVPAVMWLGAGLKKEIKLDRIEERRRRRASHDNVFATLLGLFEIRSEAYDPKLDLLEHIPDQVGRAD